MNDRLRGEVNALFEHTVLTARTVELREELYANLLEKHTDLTARGIGEDEAIDIVLAGVGDIDELIAADADMPDAYDDQGPARRLAMYAVASIALFFTALFIVCFLPMITPLSIIHAGAFGLLIAGAATCIIVYGVITTPRRRRSDGTVVGDFKQWRSNSNLNKSIRGSVTAIIWVVTTALYMIVSFATMAWYITWVMFLLAFAVDRVAMILLSLNGISDEEE